jgi:SAM-dependent methyltransferase
VTGARQEGVEAWRSVAGGWERRRALFWGATRPVSERLVELLDPRPGHTILDLAAGPGDTGFLALARLRPDGRLVSTDVAPEMVEAARRHAARLGVSESEVTFQVEDASDLSFADASFDGILCRWGLMLVPDMNAAATQAARVLRPGARATFAVWADPELNEWLTAAGRSALELGLIERPEPEEPGPFRLAGEGRLAEVLEGGGLAVEVVEDVPLTWRAPSLAEWWNVICDTSRMLSQLVERSTPDEVAAMRAGAERRLKRYVQQDGSLAVPSVARVALAAARY